MSHQCLKTEPLDYPDYISRLAREHPDLARKFAGFTGIEHVLQWMQQHNLKPKLDFVGQDEFSYDFMIELEPDGQWLVFGVS